MRIHLFNPDNDLALANGDTHYLPPRNVRRMALDLAMLPAWWAEDGDAVMLPEGYPKYHLEQHSNKITIKLDTEWITDEETLPYAPLSPWGWNAALIRRLALRGASPDHLPSAEQMEAIRRLSSRASAVEVLGNVRNSLQRENHPLTGESWMCHTDEEVERCIDAHLHTMLKAPWSGSGKGLRRGTRGGYRPPLSGWCTHLLTRQGGVVVEPLYNKVCDFAMEFHLAEGDGEAAFVGYSLFVTNANGAYEGNLLMSDAEIEQHLTSFVPLGTLHAVRGVLLDELSRLLRHDYHGYVGVDMMVCADDADGSFRLHPCVEINLRMNMGVVSHLLYERLVMPGAKGRFVVEYYPTPEALGNTHRRRTEELPLQLSADGHICSGYLPLTPIGRETQYVAAMMIDAPVTRSL